MFGSTVHFVSGQLAFVKPLISRPPYAALGRSISVYGCVVWRNVYRAL